MCNNNIELYQRKSNTLEKMLTPREKRTVSFSDVHIHEHYFILGDNPSCSRGPPSTISWEYTSLTPVSVIDFESRKPPQARSKHDFKLSPRERLSILLRSGHTMGQIVQMAALVESTKKERLQSIKECSRPKFLSNATRLVLRFINSSKKTKTSAAA